METEELWTIVYEANRTRLSSKLKDDPGKPIPMAIEGERAAYSSQG